MKKARAWDAGRDVSERRDAIMRGLNTVLRARGRPGALRMQDVADHLGLVKGNLYYYFRSKEELIYHAHVKCVQVSLEALDRAAASKANPAERVRTLIVEHILAMTEGEYGAVLLEDIDHLTPAHRRKYVALRDQFENGVRQLIKAGIAQGDFAKQDARTAGFAILGAINWIPKWYRPDGELTACDIAERFADMFVRALRA
ncbi:MAG TPA: TetR/AcrR family transcriptional regulator [Burkholderiales bacterium]|nr:TetR/AcrR family transcriptional regulator [Burkholderiales bacterium]